MGGGIDTVTISAAAKSVNTTLGAADDAFTASAAADGITVGGQDGADTFTFTGAPLNSRFAGGKGIDDFINTTGDLGTKVTIVGGEGADVVGTTNARFQTGTMASSTVRGSDLSWMAQLYLVRGSEATPSAKPPTSTLASFQVTRVLTPSLMAPEITPLKVVVELTLLLWSWC